MFLPLYDVYGRHGTEKEDDLLHIYIHVYLYICVYTNTYYVRYRPFYKSFIYCHKQRSLP